MGNYPTSLTASDIQHDRCPIFAEAWAIISAAGCVEPARRTIQSQLLSRIVANLILERREDESDLSWVAADRFVTDQLREGREG